MDAASELFTERGVQATSVAEIGARAGLSRGAVNFHFGSKDALIGEIVAELVDNWERFTLSPLLERAGDVPAAMDAILDAHHHTLRDTPSLFALYYALLFESLSSSPGLRAAFTELDQRLRGQITEFLTGSPAAGSVRKDVRAEGFAIWFLGALRGIVHQQLLEPAGVDLSAAYGELRTAALARLTDGR